MIDVPVDYVANLKESVDKINEGLWKAARYEVSIKNHYKLRKNISHSEKIKYI